MRRSSDKTLWLLTGAITAVAVTAACGDDATRTRKAVRGKPEATSGDGGGGAAQATGPKKVDPANAGTIQGTVKWDGARIEPQALDLSGNPDCARLATETVYDESLVVNDNGTVRFALVAVDSNDAYEPSAEPVVVDQLGCRYVPHVFAIQAGQTLKIKSSDQTLHNVHYIPMSDDNAEGNFAMPAPGVRERIFTGTDWIKFKCDVHPWMGAWAAVRPHPFFAVSGADGSYTIANVPAGTHKVVLKHEKLGEQSGTVTVEAGKTATLDFTLKK